MSKSQRYSEEDGYSSYQPKTQQKSVIITRNRGPARSSAYGSAGFSSQRMSMNFNPAIYTQMAGTGIADFRGNREKEKKEMQDCNERLATYIEKVRWLEAQNKKLEAEVEALRNRKQEDWKPIRDMYEGELSQARKVISDLSAQKGVEEGKMAGLQDEIQSLKDLIAQYEVNAKDSAKKIDQLNSQIGEYEGEVTTLRMRCGSLEDEIAKLRALLQKYKDENARLRADLDAETAAHIEQEVEAKTKAEECEFLQDLLDKLELMQQEPVTIKGLNLEDYFKGELRRSVQQIQQTFDERMEQCQMEMEQKYHAKMNQLQSGNVRDTMEAEHAKSEVKRLRDQLAERQARIAELEAMLASMKAERDNLSLMYNETMRELEEFRIESNRKQGELQSQIEALMHQLNELIDAKMSLELEIACYKKLLEGEENRTGLRQLVEQTIGVQSSGAANLADIIGQSNLSSSTTARTTVQRTSKGNISFNSVDPAGASITLENTSHGARAKSQLLAGWRVVKEVNGKPKFSIDLPSRDLHAGKTLTVWGNGAKKEASGDDEFVCKEFSLGSGNAQFKLLDGEGQEKATLTVKLQQ
ncbi:retrograde protein of 51 kDa-like [Babylonia areolata]|uniref:retrograde protein of 51 kDa-like n=1 Tax=Babylonia areolata TaxID=304850 RepID=UPI003FD58EA4